MNLLTYWFNPGIYKNTLKRFKLGAILYAVILFFSVCFPFLTRTPEEINRQYITTLKSYALFDGMFIIPLLLAMVVPTVVALLVFNFMHSPKHGIFVHSIPVTRTQNYFSTLLAAFTLMIAPIILNGCILMIMSVCGYAPALGAVDILKWILINIFILFTMFSVSTVASFITGNAFAAAALNIIIHLLPLALSLIMSSISQAFLYGFDATEAQLIDDLITYSPVVWLGGSPLFGITINHFTAGIVCGYIIMAAVFYGISFLLYKLRRIENCGDIVAFAVAKPIVKYTLTTITAAVVFAILYVPETVPALTAFTVAAVICAIVYFACEMLMNKTLKVWGKYKGFLGFAVSAAIVLSFCAFTSVFGYETRVPDANEVASVSMDIGYSYTQPYSESPDAAKEVTQFHKKLVETRPVRETDELVGRILDIQYKLKNGKELKRTYHVSEEVGTEAMDIMFGYEDYKLMYSGIDHIENKVDSITLKVRSNNFWYTFVLNEDVPAFIEAIKADMKKISYEEYKQRERIWFTIDHVTFKETVKFINEDRLYSICNIIINSNFTNTTEFLEQKGFYDVAIRALSKNIYITKNTYDKKDEDGGVKYYRDGAVETSIAPDNLVLVEFEDAKTLLHEHIAGKPQEFVSGETYLVFAEKYHQQSVSPGGKIAEFTPETLPDYLRKYVE